MRLAAGFSALAVIGVQPASFPARTPEAIQTGALSGRLPRSGAYYAAAGHAAELQRFVDALYWGGRDRKARPGCADARCRKAGGADAFLSIEAVQDARLFNPRNAGSNGTVVVRIVNHGGNRDFRYRTRPGREYYMVVSQPAAANTGGFPARWQLLELHVTSARATVSMTSSGDFRPCGASHPQTVSRARFDGCTHAGADTTAGPLDNIPCNWGCCETGPKPPDLGRATRTGPRVERPVR